MSVATEHRAPVSGLPPGFELRAQLPGFFWASSHSDIDCSSIHSMMTASEVFREMPVTNARGWEVVWPS